MQELQNTRIKFSYIMYSYNKTERLAIEGGYNFDTSNSDVAKPQF